MINCNIQRLKDQYQITDDTLKEAGIEKRRIDILSKNEMKYISFCEMEKLISVFNCDLDDIFKHINA